jgi:tripartite-type tricarboxylate transporter receptor subunit TctC
MELPRLRKTLTAATAAAAAAFAAQAFPAGADEAAEYFEGKTLNIVVGFGPSGGYAIYCRQLVSFMPKYIPGNPNMICQFMPGGGGLKAGNYMYNVAPKDGSTLSMISDYAAVAQLLRPDKVKYNVRDFRWVGVMVPSNPLLTATSDAKVKKFDDLYTTELALGVTGKLAQSGINASLMNKLLGTRIKIIAGYKSTGKVALAMQSGEVEATMSSWISLKARAKQLFDSGQFVPIVQVGYKRARDLPNVPLMREAAKDEETRQVLDLASGAAPFGRSVSVPPGYPKHLLAALRTAFDKTMKDEEFLSTAKKRNIEIDPSPGAELEPIVENLLNTSKKIINIAQDAAGISMTN